MGCDLCQSYSRIYLYMIYVLPVATIVFVLVMRELLTFERSNQNSDVNFFDRMVNALATGDVQAALEEKIENKTVKPSDNERGHVIPLENDVSSRGDVVLFAAGVGGIEARGSIDADESKNQEEAHGSENGRPEKGGMFSPENIRIRLLGALSKIKILISVYQVCVMG